MESTPKQHKYTNELIEETSPYLLQHAHNPVNWQAWNEKTLLQAKTEDKILLVSIGYSACHWCHVMEHESFEDEEVAAYMNEHFICIKVDREERPDVDQVYMNAVQLISGRGGWPLNCFALPDGRPFFGGTYFPKKNWLYLLENVVQEFEKDRQKVEEYADELTKSVRQSEIIAINTDLVDKEKLLAEMVEKWKGHFDKVEGGPDRAPKFPLPNNYQFLMDYAFLAGNKEVMEHVKLTLDKMAMGGIYDQIGGGFARYATDVHWKVPHFEKMLYDNAQLISLYSKAYQYFKDPMYKKIVVQSLEFVTRELSGPDFEFYSALDADSEGEEGKFYVWREAELQNIASLDYPFVKSYYCIEEREKWEGNYILQRKKSNEKILTEFDLTLAELESKLSAQQAILMTTRNKRIRPGLDDKSLTSWNALMISAFADAYRALGDKIYLERAVKSAKFIVNKQLKSNGELLHNYKAGQSSISGFLEDYAATAKAFIDLYQVTFDPEWIRQAENIGKYALANFIDQESHMFYFTSSAQNDLVARKMEITDNVIPASNSIMAHVLFELGLILDHTEWTRISQQMLQNVSPYISSYGSSYSNWASLMLKNTYPYYEVAVCGSNCFALTSELQKHYLPNTLFVGSKNEGGLPLLENKYVKGKSVIYVCVNKSCQLPVERVDQALKQISYR